MRPFVTRIVWLVLLFIGATVLPWYIVLGIGFISGFFSKNFFEVIAIGVFYDVLFYVPSFHWYQMIIHTGIAIILFVITYVITRATRKSKLFI